MVSILRIYLSVDGGKAKSGREISNQLRNYLNLDVRGDKSVYLESIEADSLTRWNTHNG